jgi:hypothetical protein
MIGDVLRLLFPGGTNPPPPEGGSITDIPRYPPDAFAAAALLLEWSGAYQYLWPWPDSKLGDDPLGVLDAARRRQSERLAAAWAFGVPFQRDEATRERLACAALDYFRARFKNRYALEATEIQTVDLRDLQEPWAQLLADSSSPVIPAQAPEDTGRIPDWWRPAMKLLIIADEACTGLGFQVPGPDTIVNLMPVAFLERINRQTTARSRRRSDADSSVPLHTFCSGLVNKDMVVVLPKTKTSQVGCTMRALTHNLAALPARGRIQANWWFNKKRPISACPRNESAGPHFNLLLVPFPYRIASKCFEASGKRTFDTNQAWLYEHPQRAQESRDELAAFASRLCYVCKEGNVPIHGVVFPENALDWLTYDTICRKLVSDCRDDIEIIIAGVSEGRRGTIKGNFVAVRGRLATSDPHKRKLNPQDVGHWDYESVRGKHHRWKLTAQQLRRYGLTHRFETADDVWENIHVGQRVIDFFETRGGACLTTLICEDLARIDPCQEIIRAVGPNLVIALLMDGPQVITRWPRHYAGVLADDPGSSVLTLTSYGLIERASPTDRERSRAVAFWRDEQREVELHLESGAHALAVSLRARRVEEFTIDDRSDCHGSYAWDLVQAQTVRDPKAPAWIVQGGNQF